jgi:HTH-type transcriptional regulator / antitoxin HigA
MDTETRPWPNVAIPPGETLAEAIDALGISQAELARRAGRPPQVISEIIQGRKEITAETAIELERVVGIPAHLWVRLEADYRTAKAMLADQLRLAEEIPVSRRCPYAEMANLGWVPNTSDSTDRVRYLLGFFGVASLSNLSAVAAWRKSDLLTADECALAAWLRKGEIDAQEIDVQEFDPEGLEAALSAIRGFTREHPSQFGPKLKTLLANLGVALVLVPHLKRTGAQGATRWMGSKAVVQLSARYAWADIFWFTLFHELSHLLLHGRRGIFINFVGNQRAKYEREADAFARDVLIPRTLYAKLLAKYESGGFIPANDVAEFAAQIGVHPGIVVGRLHHDKRLRPTILNELRQRYRLQDTTNRGD